MFNVCGPLRSQCLSNCKILYLTKKLKEKFIVSHTLNFFCKGQPQNLQLPPAYLQGAGTLFYGVLWSILIFIPAPPAHFWDDTWEPMKLYTHRA